MLRRISPIHSGDGVPEEQQEILGALRETQRALSHAYLAFDDAVDPELVESCIYEIRSLQARINYLLRRMKAWEETQAQQPPSAVAAVGGGKRRWV